MTHLILYLLAGAPMTQPAGLTPAQDQALRAAVYAGPVETASPKRDFQSILVVPGPVAAAYKAAPRAAAELLLKIAEGGRPADSAAAAGYALELLGGPGAGVAGVEMFDAAAYDAPDKDWHRTPREHWLAKAREKLAALPPAK